MTDFAIKPVPCDPAGLSIGHGLSHRVTCQSPLKIRKVVYQIARMFRREFGYDVVMYGHDGHEDDDRHRAFLWTDLIWDDRKGDRREMAVGACCFRWRPATMWAEPVPTWASAGVWAMQWVWFHPYYRRRGWLSAAVSGFRNEFGDFHIEPPYSAAMWFFLAKYTPWEVARIPPECLPSLLTPVPPGR